MSPDRDKLLAAPAAQPAGKTAAACARSLPPSRALPPALPAEPIGVGGLVPFPRLRQALAAVPRDALDRTLLDLEQRFVLELQIAPEPSRLPDADGGLRVAGRGLLYFAAARSPR